MGFAQRIPLEAQTQRYLCEDEPEYASDKIACRMEYAWGASPGWHIDLKPNAPAKLAERYYVDAATIMAAASGITLEPLTIDWEKFSSKNLTRLLGHYGYGSSFAESVVSIPTHHTDVNLEIEFNELASQWYRETRMLSFVRQKVSNICYQNIIGMGKEALPFIFKELSKGKGDWIYAIERITRVTEKNNPVPVGASYKEAIAIWMQWASDNGHLNKTWNRKI